MDTYDLFIDGRFVPAESGETFETVDPGTGAVIATVARAGLADIEKAIGAARRAFDHGEWGRLAPDARARRCYEFADRVAADGVRLALMESMDSGQVIGLSKYWGMLASGTLRNLGYHAAKRFPWVEEIPFSGNVFAPAREYIRREPVGVCVGIIPWNFPISMAIWKIAHAIVMGNTIVLKPASATPLTALILAQAAEAAGIPAGVINVVPGPGAELGRTLCTHPDVDKIAFTGSTAVGAGIMRMASGTVKKVTLELGGKSANIILDDADLDLAVEGAVFGTFFHQGQVCESGTRVLVQDGVYDQFVERMQKRAEQLRVGYQLLPDSHLGPLVSEAQLSTVDGYVRLGIEEGAELVTGGHRVHPAGFEGGCYYAPTIFANVRNDMRIAREEIFGPVVCVKRFGSDDEAVALANDSDYGLAGGVFSSSNTRAERIAHRMRTGTVWINNFHIFGDYAPFGGYKQSGVGREFGQSGLAEYTQVKRVHVNSFASRQANFTMKIVSDDPRVDYIQYQAPTNVLAGHGSLAGLPQAVVNLGCRRAMIVTDAGVRAAGLADLAVEALCDFYVGMFDDVPSDSDLDTVDAATARARDLGADCIVSVGGGSVIDTAKAVCVTLKNGGQANDYVAIMRLTEHQTPHIAIPTTAGTGSEVTNVAVIHNAVLDRKVYIVDPHIIPDVAILDPRFTLGLPPGLTAATGMDAVTHAVEALTSTLAESLCDGQALHALRLMHEFLPRAVADGSDERARTQVAVAACLAGWAFTTAQVGLAHSMAHTIGTLHHVHHGTACGIVLPHVMRYNADHAAAKLAMAAEALGVDTRGMGDHEAALAAADAVEDLMRRIGHPTRLHEVGVPPEALGSDALHALGDIATLFNARPVLDPMEVQGLLQAAF
ncbi:MAG TPA: aldehyde dehydrogenase family protein [Acidimicrobiales bacterium]|nr:aldehyde dehydrogenase family protein [Acidimicrobiales bacterium]